MQRPDKARLYFFVGLLASAILYSAYNLYILDPYVYASMSRSTRHVYKFGSIILSWLIGFVVYRKFGPPWLVQLWNIVFAAGLVILLLLAAWDTLIHELSPSLRQPVTTFHEALIAPIPYVVFGLLIRATRRASLGDSDH